MLRCEKAEPHALLPDLVLSRPIRLRHLDGLLDDARHVSVRASDLVSVFPGLQMSSDSPAGSQ